MDKLYFQRVYAYNFWAHRRVWDCVMTLSDAQFYQPLDYSIGSIYTQCVHTMSVEYWWFHFLHTGELEFLDDETYPDRAAIRTQWDAVEQSVMGYVDSMTPAELQRDVMPPFWENKPTIKVWEAMLQVANHSTDHRAQTLAGIHRLGGKTVGQDVLDYLFEIHSPHE